MTQEEIYGLGALMLADRANAIRVGELLERAYHMAAVLTGEEEPAMDHVRAELQRQVAVGEWAGLGFPVGSTAFDRVIIYVDDDGEIALRSELA